MSSFLKFKNVHIKIPSIIQIRVNSRLSFSNPWKVSVITNTTFDNKIILPCKSKKEAEEVMEEINGMIYKYECEQYRENNR